MSSPAEIVDCIRDSLTAITEPRFFDTERGFQGELLVRISRRIRLVDREIVEQEYQKNMRDHGLKVRPDIIIHEPFDPDHHAARTEGNRAVVELKLNASATEAAEDFESLSAMINVLRYPLGVFVNIAATRTHADLVPPAVRGRVVTFAVTLQDGEPRVTVERA